MPHETLFTATLIFIATYAVLGVQGIPKIHIDRPSGALLGAVAMVAFGVLSLRQAYEAIDLDTILFLLGMMILIAYLELSGFFEVLERWIIGLARSTRALLALVIWSSGLLSALFMNDTICLLYAPVILRVTRRLGLNPVPYLIALATSANIGSVATVIGNPQNALIGLRSQIPFLEFSRRLWFVAAAGLMIDFAVMAYLYRREITGNPLSVPPPRKPGKLQPWMLSVSMSAGAAMLVLLCLNFHPPAVAMGLASIAILAGSRQPHRALQRVDWTLLFLFAGLFVVMRGVETAGLTALIMDRTQFLLKETSLTAAAALAGTVALVSNIVSNVPAVMLYLPLIKAQGSRETLWLILAMSSTLAGNLTIIGSVANLLVLEVTRDEVQISFMEYLKVGLPVTVLTLLAGILLL
jgi:Na+/H+ antiporter NhaD/arsenite permease-like protein